MIIEKTNTLNVISIQTQYEPLFSNNMKIENNFFNWNKGSCVCYNYSVYIKK